MRSFPFDNANEADTSQCVSSDILADYYNEMNGRVSGIYSVLGNKGLVLADTGMTIKIMPVNGIIKGRLYKEEIERKVTLQAAGVLDRIDSVVIRQNKAVPGTDYFVIIGMEATVPIAPPPLRDGDIYDLVISRVFVGKSVTEIKQDKITDTRTNASLCGTVATPTQVDTTSIFNQYQAALDEYLILVKHSLDDTMSGHLQGQIDEIVIDVDGTRATATAAQSTANAALPKSGGALTGDVTAYSAQRNNISLRNIGVTAGSIAGALQATNMIILVRK